MVYIVRNPRCVMYTIYLISFGLMSLDLILFPWEWHRLFFYLVSNGCLLFRLLHRNGFSIFMHILIYIGVCIGLLCCILIDSNYNDIEDNFKKNMYKNFYLLIPLFIWLVISLIMFLIEFRKSELYKSISVAVHSFVGIYLMMVFFWLVCFFQHGNNSALLFEMFYMLCVLFILLTPEMIGRDQIAATSIIVIDD